MFNRLKRIFAVNKASGDQVMIQCRTQVKKDAIRRESIDGVEHIIVSSSTLPDNIVMNNCLYPAEEIEQSFASLELTLAPIEHPTINGQFVSATHPDAIHNFHAGAFNRNVRRENGRVHIDKYINVAEAQKTDRGKRLLDRIEEIENNADARPIHTSVGVFLSPELLDEPQTNAVGVEYNMIAREMIFDHDAILLDSTGAAQPHQGVGVAVNESGKEFEVNQVDITENEVIENNTDMSFSDKHQAIMGALEKSAISAGYIEEVYEDRVIFHSQDTVFEVPYVIDENGVATIVGIPLPVERVVTFTPKTNHSEGDTMRELMLKALADAGITVNADVSDEELMAKYNQLMANQSGSDDSNEDEKGIAEVVANAVAQATKPLADQIDSLQMQLNSADEAELDQYAELIGNSTVYPGLDTEAAKKLGLDTLKSMAANCGTGFGVSPVVNMGGRDESQAAPTSMPE